MTRTDRYVLTPLKLLGEALMVLWFVLFILSHAINTLATIVDVIALGRWAFRF